MRFYTAKYKEKKHADIHIVLLYRRFFFKFLFVYIYVFICSKHVCLQIQTPKQLNIIYSDYEVMGLNAI